MNANIVSSKASAEFLLHSSNESLRLRKKLVTERRMRRQRQKLMLTLLYQRKIMMQKSLLTILLLVKQLNSSVACNRSCERFQRNDGWWDHVWSTYDDIRFKRNFRVSRATFLYILDHMREDSEKDTLTEIPLSPELRLGICLYRLGRGDYLHTISELSGYGTSTLCTVVLEVLKAIVNQL